MFAVPPLALAAMNIVEAFVVAVAVCAHQRHCADRLSASLGRRLRALAQVRLSAGVLMLCVGLTLCWTVP